MDRFGQVSACCAALKRTFIASSEHKLSRSTSELLSMGSHLVFLTGLLILKCKADSWIAYISTGPT